MNSLLIIYWCELLLRIEPPLLLSSLLGRVHTWCISTNQCGMFLWGRENKFHHSHCLYNQVGSLKKMSCYLLEMITKSPVQLFGQIFLKYFSKDINTQDSTAYWTNVWTIKSCDIKSNKTIWGYQLWCHAHF